MIEAVQVDLGRFLRAYIEDEHSCNGLYVAADIFKGNLEQIKKLKDSRNRYNTSVHKNLFKIL